MRAALLSALVAAGCVGGLWVRFNASPPDRGQLYPHDLLYSYYPKVDLIGSRLASWDLPLWNPAGCAGMPLLGSIQNAILYPPMWFSAFAPADVALAGLTLLHLVIAGAGAALLFMGWRAPPVVAGALGGVFVFVCGLGQTFWLTQVFAIAWLPWILLCIERTLTSPHSYRWWAGLVAVTAMQLLAGFPQHVAYTLQLAAPWTVVRAALVAHDHGGVHFGRAARAVGGIALALGLGAGIAAVQLLPAAELIFESERRERVTPEEAHYLQSQPRLEVLLANAVDATPRNTAFEIGKGAGYVGAGTLVLAAVALVLFRKQPLVWTLAAMALLFLALSDGYLGFASPLFDAYASLPLIGSLRSPERLLLLVGFSIVGLAAMGAAALAGETGGPAGVTVAALAALGIAWVGDTQAAVVAIAAACLVAAGMLWSRSRGAQLGIACALAGLLIADVGLATGAFGSLRHFPTGWAEVMHVGGQRIMSPSEFNAQQQRVGHARVAFYGGGMLVRPIAGAGPMRGANRLACYETPVPAGWQKLARRLKGGDYRSAIAANVDPNQFGRFLDLAGVAEIAEIRGAVRRLTPTHFSENHAPVARAANPAERLSLRIWPNRNVLPRAYLVGAYEVVPEDAAVEHLAVGDFDTRNSVLIGREPDLPKPRLNRMQPAEIVVYEPERVEISTNASAAALLVLSDTDYPGWRARVDDEPVEIFRANGLFRAVVVPAGEHHVVFEYAPTSLRAGAATSGLALAGAVLESARRRRSRRAENVAS